jgi:hypothetical protein
MFDCRGKEIYLICGANGYAGNDCGGSIKYTGRFAYNGWVQSRALVNFV